MLLFVLVVGQYPFASPGAPQGGLDIMRTWQVGTDTVLTRY